MLQATATCNIFALREENKESASASTNSSSITKGASSIIYLSFEKQKIIRNTQYHTMNTVYRFETLRGDSEYRV